MYIVSTVALSLILGFVMWWLSNILPYVWRLIVACVIEYRTRLHYRRLMKAHRDYKKARDRLQRIIEINRQRQSQ